MLESLGNEIAAKKSQISEFQNENGAPSPLALNSFKIVERELSAVEEQRAKAQREGEKIVE